MNKKIRISLSVILIFVLFITGFSNKEIMNTEKEGIGNNGI